jgi:hypothetical protein
MKAVQSIKAFHANKAVQAMKAVQVIPNLDINQRMFLLDPL